MPSAFVRAQCLHAVAYTQVGGRHQKSKRYGRGRTLIPHLIAYEMYTMSSNFSGVIAAVFAQVRGDLTASPELIDIGRQQPFLKLRG